jgi:hypothetical protein
MDPVMRLSGAVSTLIGGSTGFFRPPGTILVSGRTRMKPGKTQDSRRLRLVHW